MRYNRKFELMRMGLIVFALVGAAHIGVVAQELSGQIVVEHSALDQELALQEQLRSAPNSVEVLMQLGELLARNGLHSASIPYWQRASKLSPGGSPIHLSLALELMEVGRDGEAITELRVIVPESTVVLTNLAAALARDNHLEDAVATYRKAIALEPQSSIALLSLAKALISLRRYPDALIYTKSFRQLEPDEFEGRYIEGYIYRKLGQEKEAVLVLERAIAMNADDYDAHWNLGAALLVTDQPIAAIEILRRAIQIKPSGTEAHSLLARAYSRSGNATAAEAEKEALIHIRAMDQQTSNLDMEGKLALSRGETAKAIAIYRTLTEIVPRDDQLGFLDLEDGSPVPAEAHFLRALANDPAHPGALGNLGVLYAQTGNLKRAESLLWLAADVLPEKPGALRNLALVLSASGKYDEATKILQRSLQGALEDEKARTPRLKSRLLGN